MTDAITLEELSKHAPSPVEMYRHLIDHVQGLGERGWFQGAWAVLPYDVDVDEISYAVEVGTAASFPGCNTFACIAGEAVLFAGCTLDLDKGCWVIRYDGRRVIGWMGQSATFDEVAEALGLSDEPLYNSHMWDLFAASNCRVEVLEELQGRLDAAVEGS